MTHSSAAPPHGRPADAGMAASGGGTVSRRDALQLALKLGITVPAAAALASCGRDDTGALGGQPSDGEVTELTVPTNVSPWLEAYKTITSRYADAGGVRITLREFPYDGLRTQMTNAIQSRNHVFDVFQLDEPWVAQFYANGWVTPLTEVDPSFSLDSQVLTYDQLPFWDAQRKVSAEGGTVMGLPLNGNLHLHMYRKDLYDDLGLSVPRTWEDAIANGRSAMSAGRVRYGYVARGEASQGGQSITYEFMPVLYSYGGSWFVEEGTNWTPAVNSEAAVTAMEVYRELLSLGPEQPQTVGQAQVIALMQGGESLQTHVVVAAAPQLEDPSKSRIAGKVGYGVVPAGSTGKPAPTSGTWSLAIPAGLPANRAKAALDFIRWVVSAETQLTFAQEGGIPTRSDTYQSPDLPQEARAYLEPLGASMPDVRRAVRYPFSTPMLEATERTLSEIGAGGIAVKAGMDRLQDELTQIMRDEGLL